MTDLAASVGLVLREGKDGVCVMIRNLMWVALSEDRMSVCLPVGMLSVSMNGFSMWSAGGFTSCCRRLPIPYIFLLQCGVSIKYRLCR